MDRDTEKANLAVETGIPGSQSSYERHRLGNPVTMGSFERAASQYSQYPWLSETQEKVDAQPKQDAQSLLFVHRDCLVETMRCGNPATQAACAGLIAVIDVLLLQVRRIDNLVAQR